MFQSNGLVTFILSLTNGRIITLFESRGMNQSHDVNHVQSRDMNHVEFQLDYIHLFM